MPILRHECGSCSRELTDLYRSQDPAPHCCGRKMRLLMPTHVVGRCMPDSDGVHEGSGFSGSASAQRFELDDGTEAVQCGEAIHEEATEHRIVSTPVDPDDEQALPHAPSTGVFAKDYEDCSADQRDERWRDGAESLAAWTTKQLEAKGAAPLEARVEAEAAAQGTITKARAASTRADGLT